MLATYDYPKFAFRRSADQDAAGVVRHPVVVVGAGPVGLVTAIDLALKGQPVVLLDDDDTVSVGSRGVCYAKRTLEILDRLGVGDACCAKGVGWNVGRTFHRDTEVYAFDLLPVAGHKRPGMINLQQYYLEEFLARRALALPNLDLRWKTRVTAVTPGADGVRLALDTPDGAYTLDADWLVAADGARSGIRRQLGLDIEGQVFQDRFLIADVVMQAGFPPERWFWFDPPFHPGQSVLLHRQADNVWRIDFQLGWQADPEAEKQPERVIPRIKAMLGDDRPFELEWVSVYTFQCRRMRQFRHGRVLFVGDAAHQVSPFGARGANSGIQDADNLAWKLALVLQGHAPERLLDSYDAERVEAADENIRHSTQSTDFITPKSATSLAFRNAALDLARDHAFARKLVNSGRLSMPTVTPTSPLVTPDREAFVGGMVPGAPLEDAPVAAGGGEAWLADLVGDGFTLLVAADAAMAATIGPLAQALAEGPVPITVIAVVPAGGAVPVPAEVRLIEDLRGRVAERYALDPGALDAGGLVPGTTYLIRPDQHVCARWRQVDVAAVRAARDRACAIG